MSNEGEDILKRSLQKYVNLGYDKLSKLANQRFSDGIQVKGSESEYQIEISVRWTNILHRNIRVEADIEQSDMSTGKKTKWKTAHGFTLGKSGQIEDY